MASPAPEAEAEKQIPTSNDADDEPKKPADKKEVLITDYPVHSVVVYPDRAEVSRIVTVKMGVGDGEVVLKNLSKSLDKDSVRVDGIGPASVTEVSFQEIAVTQDEDKEANANTEVAQLREKAEELRGNLDMLKKQQDRVKVQKNLLIQYSDGLFSSGKEANTSDLLDSRTIDGVFAFMDTFEERSLKLRVSEAEISEERKKLEAEIEKVNKRLGELVPTLKKPAEPVKQQVIGILLSVKEAADIQLLVSYVVSNAGWKPKYDLRVSSKERTMQMSYFGMVEQSTGEDWMNIKDHQLALSTATPSIGGSAPTLETCRLTLIPNVFPGAGRRGSFRKKARRSYGFGEGESMQIEAESAQVTEGLSSSVFEIGKPPNIPADKSAHKVHIATVNLKPTFEYDTVPKLAQHAFLRAKVINDSSYPFLAGPANVFLDQSFVTETTLNSIARTEEFSCSLGVDPSVKVVYKPVHRRREESGLITRTVTYTYKQVTEIYNARSEPAVVTFTDQVPKSQDEKLKVVLLEPVIPTKQKQGAPPPNPKLNAQNNVEWRLDMKPGETQTITIRYTVEFPAHKEVEGL